MNDVALDKTKAGLFARDVLVLLGSFLIEEIAFKNIQEYSEKGKRGSRMEFAYKGIVVKESLQTNPTLSKRWFSCNLDDCDDVFRFAICNM